MLGEKVGRPSISSGGEGGKSSTAEVTSLSMIGG